MSGEGERNATNAAPPTVDAPAAAIGEAPPATATRCFFERYKILLIVGLLILIAIAAGFALGRLGRNSSQNENRLVLYGNVDLRQVDLAFNNSERIAEVLVQEGDKITRGQILARLDTSRLKPQVASAAAMVEARCKRSWSSIPCVTPWT
jgi:multidrug resistance efflux pump